MCSVKKKVLSCLLVVILSLSTIPVNVFATTPTVVTDEAGLKAAAQNGGEVAIGNQISIHEPIAVNKDLVINLNGQSIWMNDGQDREAAFIVSGASLTIKGNEYCGVHYHGSGSAFQLNGAEGKDTELILNKGSYNATSFSGPEGYKSPKSLVNVASGSNTVTPKIVFNGGGYSVEGENSSSGGALFSGDSANIAIKEGGFSVDPTAYLDSKSYCFPEETGGGSWRVVAIAEQFSNEFKSILNDKNQLVLKRHMPTTEEDVYLLFDALEMEYSEKFEKTRFDFYLTTYNSKESTVYCSIIDKQTGEVFETHKLELVFEYDKAMKAEVDKLIAKLPKGEDMGGWFEPYYFKVTDMELINYWLTCTETNLETNVNQLINYSDEFKKQIGYKNFSLDTRMGFDGDLCTEAAGDANFKYKDTVYGVVNLGARAEHILYVSNDAQDLLAAAQKRIDDYLGKGKVKLEETVIPGTTEECYKTTINNLDHYLQIEKDSSKIVTPTYQNIDVATDIAVSSKDSSIPLDTMLEVEKLTSGTEYDKIKKAINVEQSVTFDIKLHSDSTDKYVTKLDDGSFEVRIPIPEGWDKENLEVYYVDDKEEVTTYDVTPKENYAVFLTNHFSAYTLATVKANTTPTKAPATGDITGLLVWSMAMLTSGGVTVATITDKRKKR